MNIKKTHVYLEGKFYGKDHGRNNSLGKKQTTKQTKRFFVTVEEKACENKGKI